MTDTLVALKRKVSRRATSGRVTIYHKAKGVLVTLSRWYDHLGMDKCMPPLTHNHMHVRLVADTRLPGERKTA